MSPSCVEYPVPVYRWVIYCWRCDEAESMRQGVASGEFLLKHQEHKDDTERIQLRRDPN